MWLGNLVFVLFVLLGVSKDFIYFLFWITENRKACCNRDTEDTG